MTEIDPAFDEADAVAGALRRANSRAPTTLVYRLMRRQLFSWKRDPATGAVRLSVQASLRRAPPEVAEALVRVALSQRLPREERRRLTHVVNAWFSARREQEPPPPRHVVVARGACVDLRPHFERMVAARFPSPPGEIDVGWAARVSRSLMARFERAAPRSTILVNPLLDSHATPEWYFDFLLYHEALHAVIPPRAGRGRMIMHPPEFRRAERRHPDLERAKAFELRACSPTGRRELLEARRARPA